MSKRIFIPVVGEFANVGDVMHRNELLKWLKSCGDLHVYVGHAPEDFVQGLELPSSAVIYTSIVKWLFALFFSPFGRTHFVFNSGELTVSNRRLLMEIILFPFLLVTKLKGGRILRIGVAAASNVQVSFKWLWRRLFKSSSLIMWRTSVSRDFFGLGEVIPDLAFAGREPLDYACSVEVQRRKNLIISMRWDRPYPNNEWLKAVKDFASNRDLKILVVSQVRKDNPTCVQLSSDLRGDCILWDESVSHLAQEEHLRVIYKDSLLTVSDRLHVLIAAVTEGVLPSVILTKPSDKVQHHFDVLDIKSVSIDMEMGHSELMDYLERQVLRCNEVFEKLAHAQSALEEAKNKVQNVLLS